MSINVIGLRKATQELPTPEEVGQRYNIEVNRIYDINKSLNIKEEMCTEGMIITLVAVMYCRNINNCWLEWELEC